MGVVCDDHNLSLTQWLILLPFAAIEVSHDPGRHPFNASAFVPLLRSTVDVQLVTSVYNTPVGALGTFVALK